MTTSINDNSDFERARSKLIGEIAENLAKCVTNVNQLNRNIESVAVVGAGFEPVNKLWKEFESVMSNARMNQSNDERQPILQTELPAGTDETARIGPGVVPGGGEGASLLED